MAFRISRLPWMGGRPPGFTGGMSGLRCSHSGSVRSVSYGRRHVIGAHQLRDPPFQTPSKDRIYYLHNNSDGSVDLRRFMLATAEDSHIAPVANQVFLGLGMSP